MPLAFLSICTDFQGRDVIQCQLGIIIARA